ncbi:MAG: sigma-70 family RNA polymerase sigma factor [Odoribacteraceae bacterium]|jgi:RNA polymerase sigma-70 factor (ECF subfamily)|nr:sigma-70 family RNA polymerase sigma factor [Odoribacteraceae bacterium]
MDAHDEHTLVQRLNAGDEEGLKGLFHMYYKPLLVYAMHFLDSFEEAEDVVQEVFCSFWERSCREPFAGSSRAYLFSSVRNNSTRRLKELSRYVAEPVEEVQEWPDYGEERAGREREELTRALDRLPEQGRAVFTLVVLEDMKYKEVAARLGISVNTVKTHLARSLKQLRGSLGVILFLLLPRERGAAPS